MVGAVIDDPIALKTDRLHFDAQYARADGVEGADCQSAKALAPALAWQRKIVPDLLFNTIAHLFGGFIGKCYRQDVPRLDLLLLDQVGDAPGKYARFAGARACQHQNRPLGRLDSSLLLGI